MFFSCFIYIWFLFFSFAGQRLQIVSENEIKIKLNAQAQQRHWG